MGDNRPAIGLDYLLDKFNNEPPYQSLHVERLENILSNIGNPSKVGSPIAMDGSPTGRGKTFTTAVLAERLNLRLFIVCPGNAVKTWDNIEDNWSINPIVDTIPYSQLTAKGQDGNYVKSVYVDNINARGDPIIDKETGEVTMVKMYKATKRWKKLINKKVHGFDGILLVFDESHYLKNDSYRSHACAALVREIYTNIGITSSRAICLSATPVDKEIHSYQMCIVMGIMDQLIRYDYKDNMLDLIDMELFLQYNKGLHKRYKYLKGDDAVVRKKELVKAGKKDWYNKIRPKIISSMPPVVSRSGYQAWIDIGKDLSSNKRKKLYNLAMEFTSNANSAIKKINGGDVEIDFSKLQIALQNLERIISIDVARLAKDWLDEDPKKLSKAVIFFKYLDPVDNVKKILNDYNPLIMTGEVDMATRISNINTFNKNDDYRVFIVTTGTGSESVSLHDTVGGRPRRLFITPSYRLTSIHQAIGRVFRTGGKSRADAFLCYVKPQSKNFVTLENVINALERKSEYTRNSTKPDISLTEIYYNQSVEYYKEEYKSGAISKERFDKNMKFIKGILKKYNSNEKTYLSDFDIYIEDYGCVSIDYLKRNYGGDIQLLFKDYITKKKLPPTIECFTDNNNNNNNN